MADIDELSRSLFEEAKRFLELASEHQEPAGRLAHCHAALLLGFSSLEAHLNGMAEELMLRKGLPILSKSILSEKELTLNSGVFELTNRLKIFRVEDRIEFIFANFTPKGVPKTQAWWSELNSGLTLRNTLVHPKGSVQIDAKIVARFLRAILQCIDTLYLGIFKRHHPAYKRDLDSSLHF